MHKGSLLQPLRFCPRRQAAELPFLNLRHSARGGRTQLRATITKKQSRCQFSTIKLRPAWDSPTELLAPSQRSDGQEGPCAPSSFVAGSPRTRLSDPPFPAPLTPGTSQWNIQTPALTCAEFYFAWNSVMHPSMRAPPHTLSPKLRFCVSIITSAPPRNPRLLSNGPGVPLPQGGQTEARKDSLLCGRPGPGSTTICTLHCQELAISGGKAARPSVLGSATALHSQL